MAPLSAASTGADFKRTHYLIVRKQDRFNIFVDEIGAAVAHDAVRLATTDAPGLDADLLTMCREAQAQQAIYDDDTLDEAVCDAAGRRSNELEDAAMDAAPPRTMEGAIA